MSKAFTDLGPSCVRFREMALAGFQGSGERSQTAGRLQELSACLSLAPRSWHTSMYALLEATRFWLVVRRQGQAAGSGALAQLGWTN